MINMVVFFSEIADCIRVSQGRFCMINSHRKTDVQAAIATVVRFLSFKSNNMATIRPVAAEMT